MNAIPQVPAPRWRILLSPAMWLTVALTIYAVFLAREAFWLARGPQDNDWPLLMWLARAGTRGNLAAFGVGHYGFLQLVLVRMLGPLVGGTLIAAKLINIAAVIASCLGLDRILRVARVSTVWRFAGVCFFALSYPTFVTGWSEFGDPLALALFAWGLAIAVGSTRLRAMLIGGAVVGAAGLVRLHFQTMGWGTALAFVGLALARWPRREALVSAGGFAVGMLAGQLPVFILNVVVHGTLFSPIAHSFMGQVLFGANEFDMANSYAAAPFDGVFSNHGMLLLSVISDRLVEVPVLAAASLAGALATLFRRDEGQPLRAFAVLLALGYYVGFVAPSWGITPRLLMGFVFFAALALGLVGPWLASWRGTKVATAGALIMIAICAIHFRGERRAFRALRNQTRAVWDRNAEITAVIRAHGIKSPLEVFASDWFVYATDDPEMISFYNWGFWNLLVEDFAKERPNPYAAIAAPAAFESFLANHGVRLVILHEEHRLPAVQAILRGTYEPHGFELIGRVGDQYLYGLKD